MPASTRSKLLAEKQLEEHLKSLPFYVNEYVRAKKRNGYSVETLNGYMYDFKLFFSWLMAEGLTEAMQMQDIPYSVLNDLSKKDVEFFFEKITDEKIEKSKGVFVQRSEASVRRFIQSLKSLFLYLTTESEKEDGECYFYRNVMAKIKTPKKKETASSRAKKINKSTLSNEEIGDFLKFMRYEYAAKEQLTDRQKSRFERDIDRDVAIVSLLLGSGIRVQELAGLLLDDIDFVKNDIEVLRKGNKTDIVSVKPSAMRDLKNYLDVRKQKYQPDAKNHFVFLTRYGGGANPISVRAVQNIVNKYSAAFLSGRKLSPHKLRHSFAKQWLDNDGSLVGLRDQLGHNSIETTVLYTNYSQDEQREVLNKMDEEENSSD